MYKYRLLDIFGLIVIILTVYVIFYTPINLTIVNLDFVNIFVQFIIAIILALTIFLVERHKTKTKENYARMFIYKKLCELCFQLKALSSNKPLASTQDLDKYTVTGNATNVQKHALFIYMKTFRNSLPVFINILPNKEILPLMEYFDKRINMYDMSDQDVQTVDWKPMYSEITQHRIYWHKSLPYNLRDDLS